MTITAEDANSNTATITIEIVVEAVAGDLDSIEAEGNATTLEQGSTLQLTGKDSDGVAIDGSDLTWTIEDEDGNTPTGVTIVDGLLSATATADLGDMTITAEDNRGNFVMIGVLTK